MSRQSRPEEPMTAMPRADEVLRALREAAGITQDGWAARLGYGRRTVQRWERGDGLPDAAATEALVRLCADTRLFRPYTSGVLAGITLIPDWLRDVLAEARQAPSVDIGTMARSDNLPAELTSFVGREEAVAQVAGRLATSRLVTLTGTGGVGKTRLALRVGGLAAGRGETWLVELASVADGELVAAAIAAAMSIPLRPGQSWATVLRGAIGHRPVLLLLDNCEHLLDGCAELTAGLLRDCPGLTILATSREPLGVPGEALFPVPPLSVPSDDDALSALARFEAVRLFVERACAARPDFTLLPSNGAAVARICRQLDGLPLAIELAAARVRSLSAAEIAGRLDDRFTFLASGRASPARHHTLRAAIAWSYDVLDEPDRRLFERLSIFPGSFPLAGAAAVCGDEGQPVLDGLARLVDRSLVVAEPAEAEGETTYRLLETLRLFAAERLAARGKADMVAQRYAAWVMALAIEAHAGIRGPEQGRWFREVERRRSDVLAALQWSVDRGDAADALRLAGAVCWPWGALGWGVESATLLERALAVPGDGSSAPLRAAALAGLATVTLFLGRYDVARASLAELAAIGEPDAETRLSVLATEARLHLFANEIEQFGEVAGRGLDDARGCGDAWHEGRFLAFLALAALRQDHREAAAALLAESVRLARTTGDDWSLATALVELGDVARASGESDRAAACYRESLAVRRRLGVLGATASLWHNLGYVALVRGEVETATECFLTAERQFRRWGDRRGIAECLIGLGAVAAATGDADLAARVLAAGLAALEALGSAIWPTNQADLDFALARCRERLTPGAFAAAWEAGGALSLDAAWALAAPAGQAGGSSGSSQNEAKTSRRPGSGSSANR